MTEANIPTEQTLSWLVLRLTWPSIMVRERACVELAALLLHPQLGNATQIALVRWIAEQRLESVAALGILPFLHAKMQNEGYTPPLADLEKSLRMPSLLAWLLLNELDSQQTLTFAGACRHAETAAKTFTPSPFFTKYVKNFLPPGYAELILAIEPQFKLPLWRQGAFEWHYLLTKLEITPTRNELDDWLRHFPGEEHYMGIDTLLSEVYRSAFLRTLAWAADQGVHPEIVAYLAANTCPVDLDLWRVVPHSKPVWWPQIQTATSQIDTTVADIWQQIEALWEQNRIGKGDKDTIIAACGIVYNQEIIYNLEIFGLFQSCIGPEAPDLIDIAEWYSDAVDAKDVVLTVDRPSLLRFGGIIKGRSPEAELLQFADWLVVPAVFPVTHTRAVSRWQWWRLERNIWLPAPYLAESPIIIVCEPQAIVLRDKNGEIGRWIDWADGLGETKPDAVPPKTGQVMYVRCQAIENFARQTNTTFCWLCQLTSYHRESRRRELVSFTEQRIYGASYIMRL